MKRKRDHAKHTKPKPGDEGYLTPTQLRNARKRRAKQQQRDQRSDVTVDASTKRTTPLDPSLKYASNPKKAPIVRKAVHFFKALGVTSFAVHNRGKQKGWRTVAKLPVRKRPTKKNPDRLAIGLFAPGSHQLIEVPHCHAHHPAINRTVALVQEIANQLSIPPFDEESGEGCLRHVALSVERRTENVQLTLIWNNPTTGTTTTTTDATTKTINHGNLLDRFCDKLIQAGTKSKQETKQTKTKRVELHSLYVHYNPSWKHANAIFDYQTGRWEQKFGPDSGTVEYLTSPEFPSKIPLYFPPTVFRQANLDAFTDIVVAIRIYLKQWSQEFAECHGNKKPKAVELYGGVGTIGLYIADLFHQLVSSDENPHNVVSFEKSISNLPPRYWNDADVDMVLGEKKSNRKKSKKSNGKKLRYEPKSATAMVEENNDALYDANVVVVDPPRKGLEPVVATTLRSHPKVSASCLIYVSCGFDAFCRDYESLTAPSTSRTYAGKPWKLEHAAGYLLFPGSDAIETLAIFTR